MLDTAIAGREELDTFCKRVSENIKRIRKEKNVSQFEMALHLGQKSAAFYGKAESGAQGKRFNLEHLYMIAKALGVEVSELVG